MRGARTGGKGTYIPRGPPAVFRATSLRVGRESGRGVAPFTLVGFPHPACERHGTAHIRGSKGYETRTRMRARDIGPAPGAAAPAGP